MPERFQIVDECDRRHRWSTLRIWGLGGIVVTGFVGIVVTLSWSAVQSSQAKEAASQTAVRAEAIRQEAMNAEQTIRDQTKSVEETVQRQLGALEKAQAQDRAYLRDTLTQIQLDVREIREMQIEMARNQVKGDRP